MPAGFCMGPGSLMGASGLTWAGRDPLADCATLWTERWGLTTATRAALGCVFVFLLAGLAQYLSTANGCQLQQSKRFAKRRLALARSATGNGRNSGFYDPELGACKGCKHSQDESAVHPERPEVMATLAAKVSEPVQVGRPQPTSAAMPVEEPAAQVSVKVDNWTHLGDALLRGLRILLAYLLMLVVMTYDLTLIFSIIGGFMAGFLVFGKDTAKVPVSADPCCS